MSSSPPPRASLDGLPTEIKARILEFCDRQDKWLAELHRYLKTYAEEREEYEDDLPDGASKMSTHCRDLAAMYGSTVVKVSRTMSTLFRLYIAPKYGPLFSRIEFDDKRPETFDTIVALLPYFPNLTEASLSLEGFVKLLPERGSTNRLGWRDLEKHAPVGMGRLLASLVRLDTNVSAEGDLRRISSTSRNLRSLRLMDSLSTISGQGLVDIVAALPLLAELGLPKDWPLTSLAEAADAATSRTLPRLTLYQGPVYPDLIQSLAFPGTFASSLRHMKIELIRPLSNATDEEPAYPDGVHFPHVRSLTFTTVHEGGVRALCGISSARFPSLASLRVESLGFANPYLYDHRPIATYLQSNFSFPGTLRHVQLWSDDEALRLNALDDIADDFDFPGVTVSTNPIEPFVDAAFLAASWIRRDVQDDWDVDMCRTGAAVDRTINFLNDWHRRSADEDDDGEPAPRFELVSHTKRSASLPDLATARLQDLPEELFLAIVHATAPPLLEQEHKATEWQDFLDIIQFTNKAFYRAYRALFPNFVEYSYVRESMPEVTKAFIAKLADGQVMPSVRLVHVHLGDAPTGLKFDVFFDNLPNLHTFRHYRTFGSYRFTPFDFSLLSKAPKLRRLTLQSVALRLSGPLSPLPITELELLDSRSSGAVLGDCLNAARNLEALFLTPFIDDEMPARPILASFKASPRCLTMLQVRGRGELPGGDEILLGRVLATCPPGVAPVYVYTLRDLVPFGPLAESLAGLVIEYETDRIIFKGIIFPPPPPEELDIVHFIGTNPPNLRVVALPAKYCSPTPDDDQSDANKQTTEKILAACEEAGIAVVYYEERGPLKVDMCDEMRRWFEEHEEEEEEEEEEAEEDEGGKEAEASA